MNTTRASHAMSFREIGEALGLDSLQAQNICMKALRKLKRDPEALRHLLDVVREKRRLLDNSVEFRVRMTGSYRRMVQDVQPNDWRYKDAQR